jgi:heme exporter protein CcmD
MSGLNAVGWAADWATFVDMGGRGGYVWGSVLVVLALLGAEGLQLVLRRRAALRQLHQSRDMLAAEAAEGATP